ncbi:MAG: hypothetical protein R3F59_01235 [Myxococcota bacterium]
MLWRLLVLWSGCRAAPDGIGRHRPHPPVPHPPVDTALPAPPTAETGTTTPPPPPFVVDDRVISQVSVLDPEFDDDPPRILWAEPDGSRVYVADMDPLTGERVGEPVIAATDVMPYDVNHNGPEWMRMPSGPALLYSSDQGATRWVTVAEETAPGTWTETRVVEGKAAFGTPDDRPVPTLSYLVGAAAVNHWTRVDASASGVFMPMRGHYRSWFVPGTDWLVFTDRDEDGLWQPYRLDLDSGVTEPLAVCSLGCVHGNLAWSEALSDWLLVAIQLDGEDQPARLQVFRQDGGDWRVIRTIEPPERGDLRWVLSPELFSFGGQLWVAYQLSTDPTFGNLPTEIWLVGVEPDNLVERRLSDEVPMVRKDPEYLVTPDTVWVYYSEVRGDRRFLHVCASGLHAG